MSAGIRKSSRKTPTRTKSSKVDQNKPASTEEEEVLSPEQVKAKEWVKAVCKARDDLPIVYGGSIEAAERWMRAIMHVQRPDSLDRVKLNVLNAGLDEIIMQMDALLVDPDVALPFFSNYDYGAYVFDRLTDRTTRDRMQCMALTHIPLPTLCMWMRRPGMVDAILQNLFVNKEKAPFSKEIHGDSKSSGEIAKRSFFVFQSLLLDRFREGGALTGPQCQQFTHMMALGLSLSQEWFTTKMVQSFLTAAQIEHAFPSSFDQWIKESNEMIAITPQDQLKCFMTTHPFCKSYKADYHELNHIDNDRQHFMGRWIKDVARPIIEKRWSQEDQAKMANHLSGIHVEGARWLDDRLRVYADDIRSQKPEAAPSPPQMRPRLH